MSYLALGLSLALTAFLAVNLAVSLLVMLVWRMAERDRDGVRSQSRAGGLFLLRILPATAGFVFVAGIFLPAFYTYEPQESGEIVGPTLFALAIVAASLIGAGLWRGWRDSRATRRLVRDWANRAQPIDLAGSRVRAFSIHVDYPVVSLVGVFRPRLFLSDRVLGECSPAEVSAMVGHEVGHLVSGDNIKRLAFRACPDAFSLTGLGLDMERRWHEAAEEAADDYAARASAPFALDLARALVKVARMAPAGPPHLALFSSATGGDNIERRVRRLLGRGPAGSAWPGWLVLARGLALAPPVLACAVLLDPDLLRGVHLVIEAVVEVLP